MMETLVVVLHAILQGKMSRISIVMMMMMMISVLLGSPMVLLLDMFIIVVSGCPNRLALAQCHKGANQYEEKAPHNPGRFVPQQ